MTEYISKEQFVSHFRKLLCENCDRRKQYRNGKPINRFIYEIGGPPCRACDIDDMLDWVEDFEPADVVEVVRCKDCKHFEVNHFDALNGIPIITAHNICTFWGKGCLTKVDGFCFAGEVDG